MQTLSEVYVCFWSALDRPGMLRSTFVQQTRQLHRIFSWGCKLLVCSGFDCHLSISVISKMDTRRSHLAHHHEHAAIHAVREGYGLAINGTETRALSHPCVYIYTSSLTPAECGTHNIERILTLYLICVADTTYSTCGRLAQMSSAQKSGSSAAHTWNTGRYS